VAFLGPSGSGKSTLLTLLGGIQKPSAGRIFLGDVEISRMPEIQLSKVRASRVSTMLQGSTRNLLPYATARQNLGFARLAISSSDRKQTMADEELLDRVGLGAQIDQVVSTMSGGQRQRLALACAVCTSPELLLADEPTSQLSHEDRDDVIALIHSLGDEFGTTIIVVTHQPEVAATFPRTITMKGGRVGLEGRDGAEYVVIGAEGVVHLPTHLAAEWPQGTLVRIEPETHDRLMVSKPREDPGAEGE
jgi:ABC-type lipoprotein export system ATPase subunit